MKRFILTLAILLWIATSANAALFKSTIPSVVKYPAKYTPEYLESLKEEYDSVGQYEVVYVAMDMLKGTSGEFSRKALLGYNLTERPVTIEFKDLSTINSNYETFDALGWKKNKRLYIYINPKHLDAPPAALAALLAHEALHQDEYNSLTEETYAWTMEATVWTELLKTYPEVEKEFHPLVERQNTLKKLLEKGGGTNRYIKKSVYSNPGYKDIPLTSPGFENL